MTINLNNNLILWLETGFYANFVSKFALKYPLSFGQIFIIKSKYKKYANKIKFLHFLQIMLIILLNVESVWNCTRNYVGQKIALKLVFAHIDEAFGLWGGARPNFNSAQMKYLKNFYGEKELLVYFNDDGNTCLHCSWCLLYACALPSLNL